LLSPRASAAAAGAEAAEPADGNTWCVESSAEDAAVWAAQEAMAERLPMVSGADGKGGGCLCMVPFGCRGLARGGCCDGCWKKGQVWA
jgi:hypothetical protein